MITLYELAWSHYCEKVRLSLDYMQLPWRAVSIDAFKKEPLRAHPRASQLPSYTVPAILDEATNAFVMDSTPILRYLAETYPESPQLFPGDAANRSAVDATLLERGRHAEQVVLERLVETQRLRAVKREALGQDHPHEGTRQLANGRGAIQASRAMPEKKLGEKRRALQDHLRVRKTAGELAS